VMLDKLLKTKKIPSPLIIEGLNHREWIEKITRHALCDSQSSCGKCRSCKMVDKGYHPDWLYLDEDIKTEPIKEKLLELRKKPFQSQKRVFALINCDDANLHVQNMLLKTLEEPRDHWVLLLGVNSRFSLLDTIRSRCLLYRIQNDSQKIELASDEAKIFQLIIDKNELELNQAMEPVLKNRKKTKAVFKNLILSASEKSYPGHWQNLAPEMETSISDLTRNINPKIVWEKIWSRSLVSA